MTVKQRKILIKGTILAFLIALIFFLSRYGPQPFSTIGTQGEEIGKLYTRRRRLTRFLVSMGPGVPFGFLLSSLGLTLGSWVAFEIAAILGRPFVERFIRKDILDKFSFLSTNTGEVICFLLFLLPGFPKDILCYVLGLTGMKLSIFLTVSTLGRMPGTYLLTMQGASIRKQDYLTAAIIMVISVLLIFIGYLSKNRFLRWIKTSRHQSLS